MFLRSPAWKSLWKTSLYRWICAGFSLITCAFVLTMHPVQATVKPSSAIATTPLAQAQAYNQQAQLELNSGKAETALATWKQAQKYYEQAHDSSGTIGTQINQAQALQQLGFYRRAKEQLEALTTSLAASPDRNVQIIGLQTLGTAWQNAGNPKEAEIALEKALELARQAKNPDQQSAILLNLSELASSNEDPNTAIDDLNEAEKLSLTPLAKVQVQVKKMRLMVDFDRPDEAIKLAPQLQIALSQLPPSRLALNNAINFAASINRLDQPTAALDDATFGQFMANTVATAHALKDATATAYALTQWASLYERHQQWDEAEKLAQQSVVLARQLNAEDIISQSAWELGRIQKQRGDRPTAIRSYTEAVTALQAIRGDLIATNSDMQFSFREGVEPVYRELVDLLLDDKSNAGQPSQVNLKQARDLIEALQVAELDNFFREACLDKAQQIDQIDPTATVVYPIILPDRLAVIFSQRDQPLRYYATTQPKAEIDATLTQLLTALSPVTDASQRNRISQKLYDWLIRPAELDQALKTTKTLVFVLDGKLRNIPMAALYDGQQYLIEKYAVTLSPGLQLLSSASLQKSNLNALVAGISESRDGFSALPAVEKEVRKIATTVGSLPLINQTFTSRALADRVKNDKANVVHLATHGQFSSRLEDTFLLTWDGRVNVKELSELLKNREGNANAINLLVLSACDTATGDDRAVLGLAGLAVKSGARSTIASLWPVRDKAAARLMSQFYDNLKQPNMTKAEALRQAQIQLIQKSDFNHPFFWSSFVLVGNWQ
jgi:CHAT domain-containing protein